MGVVKRMDPPHRDAMRTVRRTMDGIEMIIVVTSKNAFMVVPMPVRYMWWAQTTKEKKPMKRTE